MNGAELPRPEFRRPEFGDELGIEIKHEGPIVSDLPHTISAEGMTAAVDTFTEFLGGRILSRMDAGEDVPHVKVEIKVEVIK